MKQAYAKEVAEEVLRRKITDDFSLWILMEMPHLLFCTGAHFAKEKNVFKDDFYKNCWRELTVNKSIMVNLRVRVATK